MATTPTLHEVEPDELDYDDPADAAIRRYLNLRPTSYKDGDPHPDQRPCPSWCWVGQSNGEYQHEVDSRYSATATHSMEGTPRVLASYYEGDSHQGTVSTATIEPTLDQRGQGAPLIHVYLRYGQGNRSEFQERLRLGLTDARELVAALTYLIEVADAG